MAHITYCSLCLVRDVKIYKINSVMYSTYNELIQTENKMSINQMHACYECAHLLQKYGEFKAKCCNAYNLQQQHGFRMTEESLKIIDRKKNNLESKLTTNYKFYVQHIIENEEESNGHIKMSDFYENFSVSVKTETVEICDLKEQVTDDNLDYDATPLLHLETSVINPLENPLQIDEKHIKKEVEELLIDNKQGIMPESNIEMIKLDSHDTKLNHSTENNAKMLKLEFEVENTNTSYAIEKDNKCTENSSEDEDSDGNSSNEERDNIGVKDCDFMIDGDISLDIDSEDIDEDTDDEDTDVEGDKDNYDHDDQDSDELSKLLDKYPKIDNINVETENKKLISMLQKKKRRKKVKEITTKMLKSIDEIIKIKFLNKGKTKGTGKRKSLGINHSLYENYATVIDLTPEDALREFLLRKEKTNYKSCKYKCDFCFRGYNLETTYHSHMKKHDLEQGPIKCDICQCRFSTKTALRGHIKACHTYKFICQKCPYVCFSSTQSKAHVMLHKGKQYTCKECGKEFRYPHSVLSHYRLSHKLEFVCDLCGNAYAMETGLMAHKRRTHKKEKNEFEGPKCEDCNVHFSSERAWKRHFVLCTKHGVKNGCSICGESFNDATSLREHSRQHERKKQIQYPKKEQGDTESKSCAYCTAPLMSVQEYKNHMLKYHPESKHAEKIRVQMTNKCVCEVCGMMFTHPCFLRIHQRSHTGEKPFECDKCGKKFPLKHTLKAHQAVHTKVFPHKCHICDKSYGNMNILKKHIKYHKERPFKCTNCEKTFTFLYEMRNHVKYVHDKVPWPKRDRSKRNLVNEEDR